LKIPLQEVKELKRKKGGVMELFDNAIAVTTPREELTFSSFDERDFAYSRLKSL
jgi:hypothetical protein